MGEVSRRRVLVFSSSWSSAVSQPRITSMASAESSREMSMTVWRPISSAVCSSWTSPTLARLRRVAAAAGLLPTHFHELIHILQWRILGPERFLWLYADGLERFGYRNSPLEIMAYELQERFDAERKPFDVALEVERRLSKSQ
jgi:hypothetical protein